jgi:hypothetical protein
MPGQLKGDLVALISDSWFVVWQCAAMVIVGQTAAAKSSPKSETKKDLVSLSFFFFAQDNGISESCWSQHGALVLLHLALTFRALSFPFYRWRSFGYENSVNAVGTSVFSLPFELAREFRSSRWHMVGVECVEG